MSQIWLLPLYDLKKVKVFRNIRKYKCSTLLTPVNSDMLKQIIYLAAQTEKYCQCNSIGIQHSASSIYYEAEIQFVDDITPFLVFSSDDPHHDILGWQYHLLCNCYCKNTNPTYPDCSFYPSRAGFLLQLNTR